MSTSQNIKTINTKTYLFIGLSFVILVITYISALKLIETFNAEKEPPTFPLEVTDAYMVANYTGNETVNITLYVFLENNMKRYSVYIYRVSVEELNWTIKVDKYLKPGERYNIVSYCIFNKTSISRDLVYTLHIQYRPQYAKYVGDLCTTISIYDKTSTIVN